jgi:hypothetical protein
MIRVKADHSGSETTNVKLSINPFDEIALEEAVRLKEAGIVSGPRGGLIQGALHKTSEGLHELPFCLRWSKRFPTSCASLYQLLET